MCLNSFANRTVQESYGQELRKSFQMSRNWNKKLIKSKDQMRNRIKNEDLGVSKAESGIKKSLEITYKRTTIGIAQHLTMYKNNSRGL